VEIRFPAKEPGQQPVTWKYVLQACCGNRFYCTAWVPEESGLGMAKVAVTFANWKQVPVAPATVEIPVVDAEPGKGAKR
jgi:hypothetical protein